MSEVWFLGSGGGNLHLPIPPTPLLLEVGPLPFLLPVPCPPLPSFIPSLPLEAGPLKSSYEVRGRAVAQAPTVGNYAYG